MPPLSCGACEKRVVCLTRNVAQQYLRELRDEQRRHVDAVAKERDIGRLDRRRSHKARTKAQPDGVVGAGIRVGDYGELVARDFRPRCCKKPFMSKG